MYVFVVILVLITSRCACAHLFLASGILTFISGLFLLSHHNLAAGIYFW